MRSLINKEYLPLDNSYSLNLSDIKADRTYLAGVRGEKAQIVKITSNPFEIMIKSDADKKFNKHKFIMVIDENNCTHMILFYEWRVITDKNRQELMFLNEQELNDIYL